MKVLNVVGARPNFVKIAPLLARMRQHAAIHPILVHTGQHSGKEMVDCFWRDLQIPQADFVLSTSLAVSQPEMTRALVPIIRSARPDVVLVVGDVNSTVAAAVAAAELGIPIAHVEAGLRSFDNSMPEEINRIITDSVSTFLFASERSGVCNLLAEGHRPERIFFAGNVMIDSLRQCLPLAQQSDVLSRLGLEGRKFALLTLHRQGTVDDPEIVRQIWPALESIAAQIPVVFPVHPRTQARLRQYGSEGHCSEGSASGGATILMIPPLPYLEFLHLESKARLVLTDSGGVQEETTALGVPCLTIRNNTERPITVTEGTNEIVGLDPARIMKAHEVLAGRAKRGRIPSLWDGHAAQRIVSVLCHHFGLSGPRPEILPVAPTLQHTATDPEYSRPFLPPK